jgi:hypothetical protein
MTSFEEGWPVQRLRMGWALVLFFFFETLIGKQLPQIMPLIALFLGAGLLISAMLTIRDLYRELSVGSRH